MDGQHRSLALTDDIQLGFSRLSGTIAPAASQKSKKHNGQPSRCGIHFPVLAIFDYPVDSLI
jgi:hypothetical protein